MDILPVKEDWIYLKRKLMESPEDWTQRERMNVERIIVLFDSMMDERDKISELLFAFWSANA